MDPTAAVYLECEEIKSECTRAFGLTKMRIAFRSIVTSHSLLLLWHAIAVIEWLWSLAIIGITRCCYWIIGILLCRRVLVWIQRFVAIDLRWSTLAMSVRFIA